MPQSERGGMGKMGVQGDFTVIGYSQDSAMTSFADSTSSITSGKMFDENTEKYECVISTELATLNSVSVGDSITLVNPNDDTETYKFKVVGIYENTQSNVAQSGSIGGFNTFGDPSNQIFTGYNAVKKLSDASAKASDNGIRSQISATYTFKSIDDYNLFEEQAKQLGLSDEYTISSPDLEQYEQSLTPLDNLSKFATYFLIIILIIGAIILITLNAFNIRERKYEIGVLTAIGMKKAKVAFQFVIELFYVTFVAMIIGAVIGAVVSIPVTNALLSSQISSTTQRQTRNEQNFGRPAMQDNNANQNNITDDNKPGGFMQMTNNYITSVKSATNFTVILQLLGIGIILTIVSSLFAVSFIMRYEPLKILSNRE